MNLRNDVPSSASACATCATRNWSKHVRWCNTASKSLCFTAVGVLRTATTRPKNVLVELHRVVGDFENRRQQLHAHGWATKEPIGRRRIWRRHLREHLPHRAIPRALRVVTLWQHPEVVPGARGLLLRHQSEVLQPDMFDGRLAIGLCLHHTDALPEDSQVRVEQELALDRGIELREAGAGAHPRRRGYRRRNRPTDNERVGGGVWRAFSSKPRSSACRE